MENKEKPAFLMGQLTMAIAAIATRSMFTSLTRWLMQRHATAINEGHTPGT